jgi:uncharacterized membrane protein
MKQRFLWVLSSFILTSLLTYQVFAASPTPVPPNGLEVTMMAVSFKLVLIGMGVVALLILIAMFTSKKNELLKRIIFNSLIIVVAVPTIVLIFNTVTINLASWSNGPVHWHADYEVWACGQKLNLVDPTGWSNKIGTPTLHEHNDDRIHLEGVALIPYDASLGRFFNVIGGKLSSNVLTFPDKNGLVNYANGALCPDTTASLVQTYVYRAEANRTFRQFKLRYPETYVLSPQSQVPPGDCIIIVFGPASPVTDKLCQSWQAALATGKLKSPNTDTIPEPISPPTPIPTPTPLEAPVL